MVWRAYSATVRSAIILRPPVGPENTHFRSLPLPAIHTFMVRLHTPITRILLRVVFKFVLIRAPGGGKRLSLIQMVLLTHLKPEFEKKGQCFRLLSLAGLLH